MHHLEGVFLYELLIDGVIGFGGLVVEEPGLPLSELQTWFIQCVSFQ